MVGWLAVEGWDDEVWIGWMRVERGQDRKDPAAFLSGSQSSEGPKCWSYNASLQNLAASTPMYE